MATENVTQQYVLDRKAASRLLKISMRTLDRYAKSKRISSQVVNGRIWFDKDELARFRKQKERPIRIDSVDMSTSDLSIDVDMDRVDNIEILEEDSVDSVYKSSRQKNKKMHEDEFFENLYLETKRELNEKQERLEIANYRVGQLETQVRNSIPMLEYHRETDEKEKQAVELKKKLENSKNFIEKVSIQLRYERFSKRIFLIGLLIILALQPLWLLLIYK